MCVCASERVCTCMSSRASVEARVTKSLLVETARLVLDTPALLDIINVYHNTSAPTWLHFRPHVATLPGCWNATFDWYITTRSSAP